MAHSYDELHEMARSGAYDEVQSAFSDKLDDVGSGAELCEYLEEYLRCLASYKELHKQGLDDYLFILAGFVESPAADRELKALPAQFWQGMAKVLIYSIDRD